MMQAALRGSAYIITIHDHQIPGKAEGTTEKVPVIYRSLKMVDGVNQ